MTHFLRRRGQTFLCWLDKAVHSVTLMLMKKIQIKLELISKFMVCPCAVQSHQWKFKNYIFFAYLKKALIFRENVGTSERGNAMLMASYTGFVFKSSNLDNNMYIHKHLSYNFALKACLHNLSFVLFAGSTIILFFRSRTYAPFTLFLKICDC